MAKEDKPVRKGSGWKVLGRGQRKPEGWETAVDTGKGEARVRLAVAPGFSVVLVHGSANGRLERHLKRGAELALQLPNGIQYVVRDDRKTPKKPATAPAVPDSPVEPAGKEADVANRTASAPRRLHDKAAATDLVTAAKAQRRFAAAYDLTLPIPRVIELGKERKEEDRGVDTVVRYNRVEKRALKGSALVRVLAEEAGMTAEEVLRILGRPGGDSRIGVLREEFIDRLTEARRKAAEAKPEPKPTSPPNGVPLVLVPNGGPPEMPTPAEREVKPKVPTPAKAVAVGKPPAKPAQTKEEAKSMADDSKKSAPSQSPAPDPANGRGDVSTPTPLTADAIAAAVGPAVAAALAAAQPKAPVSETVSRRERAIQALMDGGFDREEAEAMASQTPKPSGNGGGKPPSTDPPTRERRGGLPWWLWLIPLALAGIVALLIWSPWSDDERDDVAAPTAATATTYGSQVVVDDLDGQLDGLDAHLQEIWEKLMEMELLAREGGCGVIDFEKAQDFLSELEINHVVINAPLVIIQCGDHDVVETGDHTVGAPPTTVVERVVKVVVTQPLPEPTTPTTAPPADACGNLKGFQPKVPDGMIREGSRCFRPEAPKPPKPPSTTTTTRPPAPTTTTTTRPPPPPNQRPVADAGPSQTVFIGDDGKPETVRLNGSGSFDPDGGAIVRYSWTSAQGVSVANSARPSVTLSQGQYEFCLVVTDDEGSTSPSDCVTVNVGQQGGG